MRAQEYFCEHVKMKSVRLLVEDVKIACETVFTQVGIC